ncbi:hypothetical protein D623_10001367 [Myotis brandtii]|uniref:Uncharacterized protein n=1 Tax=Myotis brandtii TaxID=109478 RepID=S7PEQ5_MYOBR|nr:hypothetical protein D623_10001367 [Myotis brandtii]
MEGTGLCMSSPEVSEGEFLGGHHLCSALLKGCVSCVTKRPAVTLSSLPPHRCWPPCESVTQESRIHMRQTGGDLQLLPMPALHPSQRLLLQREGQVLHLSWSLGGDKGQELLTRHPSGQSHEGRAKAEAVRGEQTGRREQLGGSGWQWRAVRGIRLAVESKHTCCTAPHGLPPAPTSLQTASCPSTSTADGPPQT